MQDIKDLIGPHLFESTLDANGDELPPEVTLEVRSSRDAVCEDLKNPVCVSTMQVIADMIAKHADGAPIIPSMIPGSTDSYFYSKNPRKRPVCLGFTPVRFPPDIKFGKIFHGVNERVPVEGFKWGTRVLGDVVFELCNASLS